LAESRYFGAVALTTLGFGDVTPSSDVSTVVTVLYAFSRGLAHRLFANQLVKRIPVEPLIGSHPRWRRAEDGGRRGIGSSGVVCLVVFDAHLLRPEAVADTSRLHEDQ